MNTKNNQPKTPAKSAPKQSEELQVEDLGEIRDRLETSLGPIISGKQRELVIERMTTLMMEESFSGPIPHPRHLHQYEQACPGAADRLIGMAEDVNAANIKIGQDMLTEGFKSRRLGQWLGFGALFLILTATVYLGLNDKTILATGILGTGAAGTIVAFINGPKRPPE